MGGEDFNTPPMDGGFDPGIDGGMGEDMGNQPMMDDGMMPMGDEVPNQFDTNFDAGVEADEEQDPKRYIQQLTGKLSQSLRKYNQSLPQPDADLGKYVAGMIVKQAIEGLSQEDTTDILDKLNSGEPMEEPQDQQVPQDMPMPQQDVPMDGGMEQQPMESITRPGISKDEEDLEPQKKNIRRGYKNSPFTSKF